MFLETEAEDEDSATLGEVFAILGKKSCHRDFYAKDVADWIKLCTDETDILKSFFVTDRYQDTPSTKSIGKNLKKQADAPVWYGEDMLILRLPKPEHGDTTVFRIERTSKKDVPF